MLAAVLVVFLLFRLLFGSEVGGIVAAIGALAASGALGYFFKRWNGPLIFAADGKAMSRLWPFLFGVGMVLGPIKISQAQFPIPGISMLANLALLFLSVPLAGMSAMGPMLIGSIFWKREPTWL